MILSMSPRWLPKMDKSGHWVVVDFLSQQSMISSQALGGRKPDIFEQRSVVLVRYFLHYLHPARSRFNAPVSKCFGKVLDLGCRQLRF